MSEQDKEFFEIIKSDHLWAKRIIDQDPKCADMLVGKEMFKLVEALLGFVDSQALEIERLQTELSKYTPSRMNVQANGSTGQWTERLLNNF